jgi:hypothetical protein
VAPLGRPTGGFLGTCASSGQTVCACQCRANGSAMGDGGVAGGRGAFSHKRRRSVDYANTCGRPCDPPTAPPTTSAGVRGARMRALHASHTVTDTNRVTKGGVARAQRGVFLIPNSVGDDSRWVAGAPTPPPATSGPGHPYGKRAPCWFFRV